ncbi:MAG TPA: hypothetical protein VHF47_04430 [Acidimicrobiales bacterium]|nr:hypothetical protein [Acidimicrobiales bacterium]
MPAVRTEVTELVTGLGMLGLSSVEAAVAARPEQLHNVPGEVWDRVVAGVADRRYRQEVAAAWANGQAFLAAAQGLRGRRPLLVEWRGPTKAPGDEVVPADLRVDHVYLVSCKYLSRVLANASPWHVFEHLLRGGPRARAGDWFAEVAPEAYQSLYAAARLALPGDLGLPPYAADLTPAHRAVLRQALAARQWPAEVQPAARAWACEVARASAARWRAALSSKAEKEAMLWRLLRIGSGPLLRAGHRRRAAAAPPHRHAVGLAPGLGPAPLRRVGRRGGPAGGAVDGRGARPAHGRGPRGGRPRRGALEPRPLRGPARGQGLPRHPPPPRARLRHHRLTPRPHFSPQIRA